MTVAAKDAPLVSVVIETVTSRYDMESTESMADDLAATVARLGEQTYPSGRIEIVVVVDPEVPESILDEVRERLPSVRIVEAATSNYAAAKNVGAEAARGSIIALLDGDCLPNEDWLERIVSRLEPGVAAVAGRTRYASDSLHARTLSVPDFAYVVGDEAGEATGLLINNVGFPAEVLREHPLDPRVRRNGACILLYHDLVASGRRVVYEPNAMVSHAVDDIRGRGFLRKHFGRGYDGISLYRLDERGVLRGTRAFRRYGAAALLPITARRVVRDWAHIVRYRRQMGVAAPGVAYFALVAACIRAVELVGMIAAVLDPDRYGRPAGHRA